MKKLSPTPTSFSSQTEDIDDSWGDLNLSAPREPSIAPAQAKALAPTVPPGVVGAGPGAAALDLWPPRESAAPAEQEPPESSDRPSEEPSRVRQPALPAPLELELDIDGMEARATPAVQDQVLDDLELQIESALEPASPLEMVDGRVERALSDHPDITIEPEEPQDPLSEASSLHDLRDRYAVGDFTGALVIAESVLESNPDSEVARRYVRSCREVLTQMYAARLGPLDQLVTVAIPPEQITWLSLDHRAGFLLSLIDGVSTVDEILDISGMTRLEALRILFTLVQQNVISLG